MAEHTDKLQAVTSPLPGAAGRASGSVREPLLDQSSAQVSAAALLGIEGKVRAASTEIELAHVIANELRKLVAGRQAIVFRIKEPGKAKVVCVSSLVLNDKDTPFVRWVEGIAARLLQAHEKADAVTLELSSTSDADAPEMRTYPFGHLVWQPMYLSSGIPFAAVLVARERPWSEQDRRIISREVAVFSNAWLALYGQKSLKPKRVLGQRHRQAIAAAVFLAAMFPVPMTTIAPVEIIASQPQRVTAAVDGVIREILVDPNQPVSAGQTLLRFDETAARNRLHLAEQEYLLAMARYDRTMQAAFNDQKARHELAQALAELDLKRAERDYAADIMTKTTVSAERPGVLLYTDKDRWIGRPVKTGERIMQIASPNQVAARIELPVSDAIFLEKDGAVRLFLDANPLSAVRGRLKSEGYQAEPNSTQQLVYRLHADIDEQDANLRIGARGTAQLQGSTVPLVYFLLRRPISALRQQLGI